MCGGKAPDGDGLVWRVVGASVQGVAHRRAGLPCQDAQAWRVLGSGEVIIAVADGAGTAPCAAEGARLAAIHAVDSLAGALRAATLPRAGKPEGPARATADAGPVLVAMRAAFGETRAALCQQAAAAARPLADFATTLSCAVATPDYLVTGQLGDGLVVAQGKVGLFLAGRPQRGEYANEAYFLSMEGALEGLVVQAYGLRVEALALSSDGLLRLALYLPGLEPHEPFFLPLFDFVKGAVGVSAQEELAGFLDSARVCERTDDDKTLVVAARAPCGGAPPSSPAWLELAAGDERAEDQRQPAKDGQA